ncbi:transglycosylase domain-containing protein, partial [Marinomonas arenicola]
EGILRAVGVMMQGGKRVQGASTITQQVAKNFLVGNEHSFDRKIREALISFRIESAYSKEKILDLYLNEIYLGLGN